MLLFLQTIKRIVVSRECDCMKWKREKKKPAYRLLVNETKRGLDSSRACVKINLDIQEKCRWGKIDPACVMPVIKHWQHMPL